MENFLISEDTLKAYKPDIYSSLLFRTGCSWTTKENVCIAKIDFDHFKEWYDNKSEDYLIDNSIWCQEITESIIEEFDLSYISMNIFDYILQNFDVSNNKNTAAIIGSMALEVNMEPIEFFNYLKQTHKHN